MALEAALAAKRICVQMSDDIKKIELLQFEQRDGERAKDLDEANRMVREATKIVATPVGAARFIETKMRNVGAKYGGGFPNANAALALCQQPTSPDLFIVGDFTLYDPTSPCRFNEALSLKVSCLYSAAGTVIVVG